MSISSFIILYEGFTVTICSESFLEYQPCEYWIYNHVFQRLSLSLLSGGHVISDKTTLYTISICTSSTLTCLLWKVKLLTGYRWGSLDPNIVFTICLFICIWGVKSTLIQLRKQKSYSHNRKENSHSFPQEITSLFLLTTLYTTSLIPLVYLTASISHPIPLSAAKPSFI